MPPVHQAGFALVPISPVPTIVESLPASAPASSARTASVPEPLILAFFQSHVGHSQIDDELLEPFILVPQLLDFLAVRFPLGVPAQTPLARLDETL